MSFKKFWLKYFRPDLDEEIDEEFTIVHQTINLCPACGNCNCIIKTPRGIIQFNNIFAYRMWKEHTFNCMRCSFVSKIKKVPLKYKDLDI